MIIRRNPGTLNMPAAPNGFLELVFKLPWVMLAIVVYLAVSVCWRCIQQPKVTGCGMASPHPHGYWSRADGVGGGGADLVLSQPWLGWLGAVAVLVLLEFIGTGSGVRVGSVSAASICNLLNRQSLLSSWCWQLISTA